MKDYVEREGLGMALSLREHLGALIALGNPSVEGFIRARANPFFPQEKKEDVSQKDNGGRNPLSPTSP